MTKFGDLSRPVPEIHKDTIQYAPVGHPLSDPLDDMFDALARFTFRVAVSGYVSTDKLSTGEEIYIVTITEVGTYVFDSYDFNGHQVLGWWDAKTNSVTKNPFGEEIRVDNGDFRDWRDRNHRGGDFLVFSDIKVTKLSPRMDTFQFSSTRGIIK